MCGVRFWGGRVSFGLDWLSRLMLVVGKLQVFRAMMSFFVRVEIEISGVDDKIWGLV